MLVFGSLVLAALALQGASDTTRASRQAYTGCLRAFVDRSITDRMTQEAFDAAFPQQCAPQLSTYRAAIIARETATRAGRADAEETANLEIEDSQVNQRDMFTPPPSAPTAQQAAAAPTTPPATPASQPTPQ